MIEANAAMPNPAIVAADLARAQGAAIVPDLSNEAYHAGPGLSHSGLKRLHVTPYHFHALNQAREAPPKAATPAMVNGTLVHCALLEPAAFLRRYVVASTDNKRSAEWKRLEEQTAGTGKEIITQLQHDRAFAQAAALATLDDVAPLLADGAAEISVYWTDPETHVLCKCRPDLASKVGHGRGAILLDVKTTTDASPDGFARAVQNFGYHTQADWYCTGYELASGLTVHGMVFAVVESEYPFAAAAYMLSDAALLKARERNREGLKTYARCAAANDWPGYPRGITVIDLPRWAA